MVGMEEEPVALVKVRQIVRCCNGCRGNRPRVATVIVSIICVVYITLMAVYEVWFVNPLALPVKPMKEKTAI